jgi:lysophospholipase L1-like esterase
LGYFRTVVQRVKALMKWAPRLLGGGALALACLVGVGAGARANAAPARPVVPDSMAAIGDSITQAYDDCCSLGELGAHPQDSWSTGDGYPANGIESHYVRIFAMNPSIAGHAYNDSGVGATVADTESQAQLAVAQGAQYVTILIGADDACTGTIASMTPTSAFQAAFQTAMSTLESGLPAGAHIFVSSIPNIYQLWSVLHTNPLAQLVWSFGICQSMLSTANTEAQRQQVLAQVVAYNAILSQVCGQYANCRWDGGATFDYQFSPSDVSTVDYFHPSQTGQAVLAGLTWAKSWWPLGLPTTKDQCNNGGWRDFSQFKNQGECIQFVNTGK